MPVTNFVLSQFVVSYKMSSYYMGYDWLRDGENHLKNQIIVMINSKYIEF